MKKLFGILLTLALLTGMLPALGAQIADGAPVTVRTTIAPSQLSAMPGEFVELTATTVVSTPGGSLEVSVVSETWEGVSQFTPALTGETSLADGFLTQTLTSTASLRMPEEPGDYDALIRYALTLSAAVDGQAFFLVPSSDSVITLSVMEEEGDDGQADPPAGQALNHGQIVSAWAQWKQTKGNRNFREGGPGLYRSLVWYKAQVEYKTFHSRQEVWDYLDSIYEPAPGDRGRPENPGNSGNKDKKDNPGKGN